MSKIQINIKPDPHPLRAANIRKMARLIANKRRQNDAARACGIAPRTLRRWLHEAADIQHEYDEMATILVDKPSRELRLLTLLTAVNCGYTIQVEQRYAALDDHEINNRLDVALAQLEQHELDLELIEARNAMDAPAALEQPAPITGALDDSDLAVDAPDG